VWQHESKPQGFASLLQKLAATPALDYAKPTDWWTKKGCEKTWLMVRRTLFFEMAPQ
jgi:hypothetical protein